jgi:hypothetical protein
VFVKGWSLRAAGPVAAILTLFVLLPAGASADLCNTSGQICIVNPPTAASPWVAPQLVQLRLPSEANPAYSGASWTQPGVPNAEFPHSLATGTYPNKGKLQLVEPGSPGGTSLYQGTVEPNFNAGQGLNLFLPADGTLTLTVEASASDPTCQCVKTLASATFTGLPVLGAVTDFSWQIVRSGKWFRAIMSFEARTPVRATQIFHVSTFKGGRVHFFPTPLMTRQVTGSGPLRIVQKLSAAYVQNKCSGYQQCRLYAEGEMGSAAESRLEDGLLSSVSRPIVIR